MVTQIEKFWRGYLNFGIFQVILSDHDWRSSRATQLELIRYGFRTKKHLQNPPKLTNNGWSRCGFPRGSESEKLFLPSIWGKSHHLRVYISHFKKKWTKFQSITWCTERNNVPHKKNLYTIWAIGESVCQALCWSTPHPVRVYPPWWWQILGAGVDPRYYIINSINPSFGPWWISTIQS